jgi:hypothetical protein
MKIKIFLKKEEEVGKISKYAEHYILYQVCMIILSLRCSRTFFHDVHSPGHFRSKNDRFEIFMCYRWKIMTQYAKLL